MEGDERGHTAAQNMYGPRKGGFRAAMFIFAMTGFENIGFVANMVSLVLYFFLLMHFNLADSATTLTNFMGSTFLLTIVAGFISDTYLTRLNTVLLSACFEILGYILMIVQAHRPSLRPPATCLTCKVEGRNAALFYIGLSLLAIGYGGVRGSYPALGGDQFDKNNPKERMQLASFFNWVMMSITTGATFGVTFVVWVSTERSWAIGFLIAMLCATVGFAIVLVGRPFYRVRVIKDSPLVRLFQVVVVAFRNRKMRLPENRSQLYGMDVKGDEFVEEVIPHTEQFRFLDKAAVLARNTTPEAWKVCSVTQVEELKIIIRMLPVLASTVLMNTCLAQLQTFTVQQGNIMDLRLGSFKVPAASIPVIPLLFMTVLLPVYELVFVPIARRLTGHPTGITTLQRVGVGLFLSAISMAIAALVEVKRRNAFNDEGKQITLFWLSYQYGIFGIADMFTLVGLMDFFYSEAPAGMRSLSTSFSWLSLSFGYFLSTVLVRAVNSATARMRSNGQGWLYGVDLNANRLDLFYWFLAVLSCVNFMVYLACTKWYKYREDETNHHGHVVRGLSGSKDVDIGVLDKQKERPMPNAAADETKDTVMAPAHLHASPTVYPTLGSYPSPGAYPSPAVSSVDMYSPMTLERRELIQ